MEKILKSTLTRDNLYAADLKQLSILSYRSLHSKIPVQLQTHAQDEAIIFYLPLIATKDDQSQTHSQDEAINFYLPLIATTDDQSQTHAQDEAIIFYLPLPHIRHEHSCPINKTYIY